jgi:hypothetical protein
MARCPLLARVLHSKKTRTARCPSARRKTAKTKNSSAYRACVRLPACAGTGFIRSRSRLLQGLAAQNRRGRRFALGRATLLLFLCGRFAFAQLRRGNHRERLTEPLLQSSIAPHQFQKANRIAQWTNFAHLIGVNSRDWDRFNPVAFTAGDDEHFGIVIESVSAPK